MQSFVSFILSVLCSVQSILTVKSEAGTRNESHFVRIAAESDFHLPVAM